MRLYKLGEHRLLQGDSTKREALELLMNGSKADMVFTDPPYGMRKKIKGDNMNDDELLEFNKKWIPLSFDFLKGNGSWYCWGKELGIMDIYTNILKPKIRNREITYKNMIIWDKGSGKGQNSDLMTQYVVADEKCLFLVKGYHPKKDNAEDFYKGYEPLLEYLQGEAKKCGLTAKKVKEICGVGMYSHWFSKSQWQLIPQHYYETLQHHFPNFDRNWDGMKKEYKEIQKEYNKIRAKRIPYFNNTHANMNNVWKLNRVTHGSKERVPHPTQKPIAVCERAILSSSREGEIVLDMFGGSGSTLIACERTGRCCYMVEYDEKWINLIISRWEKETGRQAEVVKL